MRSRSANAGQEEESIFGYANISLPPVVPKTKVYHVGPVTPSGAKVPVRNHADSSQISSAINPVSGLRDQQRRAGIEPTNFARGNVAAIKEQSKMNALRKMAQEQSERAGPGRFGGERSTSAPSRRPAPARFSNPGYDEDGQLQRDFVAENRMGAGVPMRPPRPSKVEDDGLKYLKKKDMGKVPTYLLNRKMELAAEQEAKERAKEASTIPPGMRMLPEEERLETLAILENNRREVESAIQRLPIIIETPSAVRRKEELERRLREIEDAARIFSRPKVLVHM